MFMSPSLPPATRRAVLDAANRNDDLLLISAVEYIAMHNAVRIMVGEALPELPPWPPPQPIGKAYGVDVYVDESQGIIGLLGCPK